ncbi:MAG: glycosyltransferase [Nanoarchaeota archaeon]
MVKVSIIIPVKEINEYVKNFVPIILKQKYRNFEILIIPDKKTKEKFEKTRIIPSGETGPAQKRDLGVKKAKGEIIAFIDDDAYPEHGWIENALYEFRDKNTAIVGGPNITPEESNFFQKLSGEVLSSYMISGPVFYRYKKSKRRFSQDLPSCNLFVRKKIFEKVRGFDTSFWPGEDTKFCLDVLSLGKKIVYSPEVLVYHHRRKDILSYIDQIFNYSMHRGFFCKKYPETSFRLSYFIPSVFLLFLIFGGLFSLFHQYIAFFYFAILAIYLILLFIESIKTKKLWMMLPFILLSFITHLTYGIGFLVGIFRKNFKSSYLS